MSRLFLTAALLLVAIVVVRLWPRISAAFRKFDADNIARIRQEQIDRGDQLAHFRHTLGRSEEQVEEIFEIFEISELDPRTATAVTRYVFEGERFATRWEAEKARAQKIGDIARGFYRELPAALSHRGKDRLH
ncbi:MAG TPA: hypothetical protein VIM56_17295 [Rhizomicrobium sp.]